MRLFFVAAVALCTTLPANAGVVLWQNVEVGMTLEQLRALYPEVKGTVTHKPKLSILENVQQVGRCHPDVLVEHPSGAVTKVLIRSRYRGFPKESCGNEAEKALLAKYGSPLSRDEDTQKTGSVIGEGLFMGLDTTRNARDYKLTWVDDGIIITLERFDPGVDDNWLITYEPKVDIGL